MKRIECYISKANVRRLLENYYALNNGDVVASEGLGNSGPKADDGVSGGRINLIMIDDAVKKLPEKLRKCVQARWLEPRSRTQALAYTGLGKDAYYSHCDAAVVAIYNSVNGRAVNYEYLMSKIVKA